MFRKIKANIIIGRLHKDFLEAKKSYPQFNNWQIYLSLLSTLKLQKPFSDFTGEDAIFISKELDKLKDLEKGFEILSVIVHTIIIKKIENIIEIKRLLSEYVNKQINI